MPASFFRLLPALLLTVCSVPALAESPSSGAASVLATVNDQKIREKDLETLYLIDHVAAADRDRLRGALIEQLVDNAVIDGFLKRQKVVAPQVELDANVAFVLGSIEKQGDNPAEVLKKVGLTEETLRQQLALPIAWAIYVRKTISDDQVRKHFEGHRAELDGSKVRVRQIVLLVDRKADDAAWKTAGETLSGIRKEIASGQIAFEEAARKHSQSPSGQEGGNVVPFGFDGKMPRSVTEAAFALKEGELSEVVRSPFGMHLLQLVERMPGDLSVEDARPKILEALSRELWTETLARERKKAKITVAPQ